jgi:hypothetical protein
MTISAKVILDSVSPDGIRLPTVLCRYPKCIHGESKTHRVFSESDTAYELLGEIGLMDVKEFSRNASSSRAIPVSRLIDDVIADPYIPIQWGRNKPGMQAGEELEGTERQAAIDEYMFAMEDAIRHAKTLAAIGASKQIVNRIIEPYCHIRTLITATEWDNFFALRCNPLADPLMRALAEAIRDALAVSTPTPLAHGAWHLPFVEYTDELRQRFMPNEFWSVIGPRLSGARCARLSYLTQDGRAPGVEEDLGLFGRLASADPMHASPMEHQATPDRKCLQGSKSACYVDWERPHLHGNFVGMIQHRKLLEAAAVR